MARCRNVSSLAEKKNYPENMSLYDTYRDTHVERIKWKKKAEANEEIISFLKPPQYAKNDYIEQKTAKYVFKCLDGDIQIPEYGMFRTDFYHKQIKAREIDKNGHIFNYNQFPRASVKFFTDALFGVMPECNDIVETMQLMAFLLFDGQANEDFGSDFEIKFLQKVWKQLKSLMESKTLDQSGTALVILYFVSLDKPEFTQFAKELSSKSTLTHCFAVMSQLIYKKSYGGESEKIMTFIREYCKRNDWKLSKWLKFQIEKVEAVVSKRI